MNRVNEWLLSILTSLRKLPRWALILISTGVVILLGFAMLFLIPQQNLSNPTTSTNPTGLAFNVFLKMGVIIVILIGIAIVIRQMQSKMRVEPNKKITIIDTIHLSSHRTIHLISVDNEKILIGATDQSISTLMHFSRTDTFEQSNKELNQSSFSEIYKSAQNGFKKDE
mgnify:FL=1